VFCSIKAIYIRGDKPFRHAEHTERYKMLRGLGHSTLCDNQHKIEHYNKIALKYFIDAKFGSVFARKRMELHFFSLVKKPVRIYVATKYTCQIPW